MLLKCCIQYISKFGKPSSSHRTGEGQFSSQFQRSSVLNNAQTKGQFCSLPILVKLCSKSFKLASVVLESRTSRCTTLVQKRQRNQRSNCRCPLDHRESKGIPDKNTYFCFIDYAKAFDCVDTTNCGKLLKRQESQTILPVSSEASMQVQKQQLEPDMKQLTGSKLRKEYSKALYCQLCLFNLSYAEYIM